MIVLALAHLICVALLCTYLCAFFPPQGSKVFTWDLEMTHRNWLFSKKVKISPVKDVCKQETDHKVLGWSLPEPKEGGESDGEPVGSSRFLWKRHIRPKNQQCNKFLSDMPSLCCALGADLLGS